MLCFCAHDAELAVTQIDKEPVRLPTALLEVLDYIVCSEAHVRSA